MPHLVVVARKPFSFYHTVRSHGWYQLSPCSWSESDGILDYTVHLESGKTVALRFGANPEGVDVHVHGRTSARDNEQISAITTWMFDLDASLAKFYAAVRDEPRLRHARRHGHGRILRSATIFEDVVKTILTTNTLWSATKRMCSSLVDLYGEPTRSDPRRIAFPTPERLAKVPVRRLQRDARLGYRAEYVHALSASVAAGRVDLEELKTNRSNTHELREKLLSLKGVGPYAAANLLLMLGRTDYLPIDSWARKLVSHEWHNGEPVGPAEVEAAFSRWGEWKGLVYWFWKWKDEA
jgi:3-methyladenine DNA glycosylase/8-oxoguanine DNA glycosylase